MRNKELINKIKNNFPYKWVFSFLSAVSFSVNFNYVSNFKAFSTINQRFSSANFPLVLLAFVLPFLSFFLLNKRQKRVDKSWQILTSIILSLFALLGESVSNTLNLDLLIASKVTFLISIIVWAGFAVFIYASIDVLKFICKQISSARIVEKVNHYRFPNFYLIVLIVFLLWLPVIIYLLPGTIGYDGSRQLDEFFRVYIPKLNFTYFPTNHHPWFATLVMGGIFKLGLLLFHSNTGAFYLHSTILLLFSIFAYSGLILRVRKLSNNFSAWMAILFFGLEPHFSAYAVCFDKTGWFLASTAFFVSAFLDVVSLKKKNIFSYVFLIISALLVCLFRNNGIYVVLPAILLAIFLLKNIRRTLLIVFAVIFVVYEGWSKIVLKSLDVMPSSPAEMLVAPIQQTSFIVTNHPKELTKEDRKSINKVMYLDKISKTYNPTFGDSAKNLFRYNSFLILPISIKEFQKNPDWWKGSLYKKNVKQYLVTWAKMGIKHPLQYVNATLDNQFLSLDPIPARNFNRKDPYGSISIYTGRPRNTYFVLSSKYLKDVKPLVKSQKGIVNYLSLICSIPIFNIVLKTALWNWLAIAMFIYFIFKRNKLGIVLTLPSILTFLINLDGSVNGDPRYAVPIEIMMIAPLLFINSDKKKKLNK